MTGRQAETDRYREQLETDRYLSSLNIDVTLSYPVNDGTGIAGSVGCMTE